jgi:hypothetical protein
MTNSWPQTPLGEILTKSEEWTDINPTDSYREITVRLWGQGVILRREAAGSEIASSRRLVARAGQFILSRIDARNGAFGLVPNSLDRAIVSNDFPLFTPNLSKLEPSFLDWISRTRSFVDICKAASEGTTNRVRLQEDRFLQMKIPLPLPPEQRRIVARIEELAAKINEARGLREEAVNETKALLNTTRRVAFESCSAQTVELQNVCSNIIDNLHSNPQYAVPVCLAYALQMSVMEHSISKVRSAQTRKNTDVEPYAVNQNQMMWFWCARVAVLESVLSC